MKYFKTDGIRGEAYTEVTLSLAYKIGLFFSTVDTPIVVGIDTRESSPELALAILKGLEKHKNVSYAGVIPTPGLMYYSLKNNTIGIMVTASHNNYKDNGIKIFESGEKINKEYIKQIETFIDKNNDIIYKEIFDSNELNVNEEIIESYLDFLTEKIPNIKINVVFDGANGAFSDILKQLFSQNNLINCSPNGRNINLDCGSQSPSRLINAVKTKKADIGIAFDGDGDRFIVVDKFNRIYEGDLLTYIFAKYLYDNNLLLGNTVVFTEVVNPGILHRLDELDIQYILVEVGDQHIYKALESGYVIGGEASGHVINKTILPFGDGLVNALELIKILKIENKKMHEYLFGIKLYQSKKQNLITNPNDFDLSKKTKDKIERFTKRRDITFIYRKSGTEKLIRLFLYQPSNKKIDKNMSKIVSMIKNDR